MKIILLTCIFLFILFSTPSITSAYGGGVTPPVYNNPYSPVIVECKMDSIKLPFDREISIPKCKVVKNPDFKNYNKEFEHRIKDFLKRLKDGGN